MQKRKTTKTRAANCTGNKNHQLNMSADCESESFQQQALLVRAPGENFDPAAVPQNGEEFLMKMLYERKHCPAVVVKRPKQLALAKQATTDTPVVPGLIEHDLENSLPNTPRPTAEWKAIQAADFLVTRDKINNLRAQLNEHNYSNELEPPLTGVAKEWQQFCRQNEPLLSTILRINQRVLEQLLEMMRDWLSAGADPTLDEEMSVDDVELDEEAAKSAQQPMLEEPVASSSAAAAAAANGATAMLPFDLSTSQQWLGSWLYATLACLHLPLEPNVHSTLRDIARACMRLRSRLLEQEEEKAVPYNLFIFIIAKVFDQLDFIDCV